MMRKRLSQVRVLGPAVMTVGCFALLLLAACSANNNAPKTTAPASQATTRTVPTVPAAVASAASAIAPAASAIASAAAPIASAAASRAAGVASAASSAAAPVRDAAEALPCKPGQVKGDTKSKLYHTPDSRDYARTKLNVECFDNAQAAEAAGYRAAQ